MSHRTAVDSWREMMGRANGLAADFRAGVRSLARQPAFSLGVISPSRSASGSTPRCSRSWIASTFGLQAGWRIPDRSGDSGRSSTIGRDKWSRRRSVSTCRGFASSRRRSAIG